MNKFRYGSLALLAALSTVSCSSVSPAYEALAQGNSVYFVKSVDVNLGRAGFGGIQKDLTPGYQSADDMAKTITARVQSDLAGAHILANAETDADAHGLMIHVDYARQYVMGTSTVADPRVDYVIEIEKDGKVQTTVGLNQSVINQGIPGGLSRFASAFTNPPTLEENRAHEQGDVNFLADNMVSKLPSALVKRQ